MGMPDTIRWTRDQVLNLPADGNRYELVDGELIVSPSPCSLAHQVVLGATLRRARPIRRGRTAGARPLVAGRSRARARTGQPARCLRPAIDRVRALGRCPVAAAGSRGAVTLDCALRSRPQAPLLPACGVPEYWIVDIDGRVVERWRPGDSRPESARWACRGHRAKARTTRHRFRRTLRRRRLAAWRRGDPLQRLPHRHPR